ncbi:CobW family GTP-binding protein [Macrococcus brunensis]|uniref:CobW family GTP-binding protein n=1 Tax=Macrococcus brunensis TaxID=198483 RepID=UPI001EF0C5EE|nr:GTP-binding protein [Macrococcus brunensis]ULG74741.1 GTP-binding protein [Macrococcus brunensis]
MNKIKLYIISGFLGSGKTTLLKQMLTQWQGQKVAILMNELGQFNVDSTILGDDTPMNELLNGCICCDLKSDVEVQLHDIRHRHQPDIIIIEATGVAHPVEIYDACLAPSLTSYIQIQSILTLVDGPRFLARAKYSVTTVQLMEEQVRYAHSVMINKKDLMTEDEIDLVRQQIQQLNSTGDIYVTSYSAVPDSVFELEGEKRESHQHLHHGIQSMVYTFSAPVDSRQFVNWLRELPDSVLRIKGYIKFRENPGQVVLFQYSYGIPQYEPEDMNLPLKLVVIGEQLDKNKILDQLDQLQFS